jgi:CTP:molybdopterin cytidylyltransferase MocA
MKPTLVILAAGMGSRYGGLKQLDEVGPNGEAIIDYSLFDAIRAGFGKVVSLFAAILRTLYKSVLMKN